MLVHVTWESETLRKSWYDTPYAAYYHAGSPLAGGPCVTIMGTVDRAERTIYMNDVKSVGIWQGGKEIRHYCHVSKSAVEVAP